MTGTSTAWLGVNNEAKELFGSGSSGGGNMVPTWLITTTQTWSVPVTGNYRLICIGKGGDGGSGYSLAKFVTSGSTSQNYGIVIMPSTSGAGGAVAIADRELQVGDSLVCNFTDSNTNIGDTLLIADNGENGITGYVNNNVRYNDSAVSYSATYSLPKGGSPSGSWLNYGYPGNDGMGPTGTVQCAYVRATSYTAYDYFSGQRGGDVGCAINFGCINGNAGIGAFISPVENGKIGQLDSYTYDMPYGGYAGAGGAAGTMAAYVTTASSATASGCGRGAGGIGAILIQFLGE